MIDRNELKAEFTDENKPLQKLAGQAGRAEGSGRQPQLDGLHQGRVVPAVPRAALRPRELRCVPARLLRPLRVPVDLLAAVRRLREGQPARQVSGQGHAGRSSTSGCTSRAFRPTAPQTASPTLRCDRRRAQGLAGRRHAAVDRHDRAMDDAGVGALHRRHARHAQARAAGSAGRGVQVHRHAERRDRAALVSAGGAQRLHAGATKRSPRSCRRSAVAS